MAKVSGIAVAEIITGTVLFWSGFKGQSVAFTLKDFLKGKIPQSSHQPPPAIGVTSNQAPSGSTGLNIGGGSPPGSTTESAIANDAQRYVGHPYLYGGAPGPNGQNPWDCSSFVNWVLGHDLGLDIPGVQHYAGATHGPTTQSYLIWGGGQHIARNQVAAGDLLVWQAPGIAHMGIAISNTQMVSAEDPANGTQVGTIDGFFPVPPFCIRVRAASQLSPGFLLSRG